MVAALRFRVNGDYDAYFYPVGTYNKIDWENELPCQLGTDYSVYLSKSEDNIEAIDIVNGLDGKPILRLIETKQYIIKLDKKSKDFVSLPILQNENNKAPKIYEDENSVTFQYINYLGRTKASFSDSNQKRTLVFEVVPNKMDYEDDYIELTESIAEHCSELLLEYSGLTSNVFSISNEDSRTLLEQFIFLRRFCFSENLLGLFEAIKRNPDRILIEDSEFKPIGCGVPSRKIFTHPLVMDKNGENEEFILVQQIIAANIKDCDRINQEYDLKLIKKNLGEDSQDKEEESNDIDSFDASTPFFSYRFGKAFPGVRGIKEFSNPKECVDRLQILLKKPLSGKKLGGPIWWFRGGSNLDINNFERISDEKFLMDCDEIKVKRIVAYAAGEYYKKFVYVEAYPEEETGLYQYDKGHIKLWADKYGYYNEEYAEYENKKVTRSEYDDGAAVIDGKVVDLKGEAKLRIRYITPYNFIICAQFNPINNDNYDDMMVTLLNGILKGQNSVEEIVEFVNKMPRDRRDM